MRKLITIISLFSIYIASAAGAQWRLHGAFDRTPVKIIDSPTAVYFMVHQQIYQKNQAGYDFPSLTLFKYDKTDGKDEIKFLNRDGRLSSSLLATAEYSPVGNCLAAAYMDGKVDVIYPDGRVVPVNSLMAVNSLPGAKHINQISFDPESTDLFLSTDVGYFRVDGKDQSLKGNVLIGSKVKGVAPVGNGVALLMGSDIYFSDSEAPTDFGDFRKIGNISGVSRLLVVGKGRFAFVKGTPGATSELFLAEMNESGDCVLTSLCKDNFTARVENESYLDRYEGNFIANRDGYIIYSSSKIWQMVCNDAQQGKPYMKYVGAESAMNPVGCWDGAEYWTYRDRGTFVRRIPENPEGTTAASANWKDCGSPLRPDAPAAYISFAMDYSPGFGTLTVNHGNSNFMFNNNRLNPTLLSAWDGTKWQLHSHAHHMPQAVAGNEAAVKLYNQNINFYPAPDPTGMAVDPENGNCLLVSSMFGGITMQDLRDIDKLPLRFCAPTDLMVNFPGSYPVMEYQSWKSYCCFSTPTFDNKGTAWCSQINFSGSEASGVGTVIFKYLTAERRKKLFDTISANGDASDIAGWETLNLPYYGGASSVIGGICFKHPSSENYLLMDTEAFSLPLGLVNHNGTLADTSDDTFRLLKGIVTSNGAQLDFIYSFSMEEDPLTGELWFAGDDGLWRFHPAAQVNDQGYIKGDIFRLEGEERECALPERAVVNKIIFDSFGRMWLGTNNQGVVGVSSDRKSVVARYTAGNSPLPSDKVYGLGWNPALESLMISTEEGIAEVVPDSVDTGNAGSDNGMPTVFPTVVTPDFNGYISLRRLPVNAAISLYDKEGKEVKRINNGTDRFAVWDLTDNSGNKLPAGVYTLRIDDSFSTELIVMTAK